MSDKKIGRWAIISDTGEIWQLFESKVEAFSRISQIANAKRQLHTVIYMEETEPPKREEECPKLELGDFIRIYRDNVQCCYYVQSLDLFIKTTGKSPQGFYSQRNNFEIEWIDELYRHGRMIWRKGKLQGEE